MSEEASRVVVLDSDVVRRALLQCALPLEVEVFFATHADDVPDADLVVVGPTPGGGVSEVCRALRARGMVIILADERYTDERLAQQEVQTYRAGAWVAPPFAREALGKAIAEASRKRRAEPATIPPGVMLARPGDEAEIDIPMEDDPLETTSPEKLWDLFRERVESIYRNLDRLDHYQILEVSHQAAMAQIKEAYQLRSLEFHPDRFATHPNEDFRRKLYDITKAVTTAFRVLSDPTQRAPYDAERRPKERPGAPMRARVKAKPPKP